MTKNLYLKSKTILFERLSFENIYPEGQICQGTRIENPPKFFGGYQGSSNVKNKMK